MITPPPLALDNKNDMPAMCSRVGDCCSWIDRSNAGLECAVKIGGVDVCTEVEPHTAGMVMVYHSRNLATVHPISLYSTAEVAATNGLPSLEGRGNALYEVTSKTPISAKEWNRHLLGWRSPAWG